MTERKKTLCLDFDGVIHSYTSGWQGPTIIRDPPVPGAISFIIDALEKFDVCIYSSRSAYPDGIPAMRAWLRNSFRIYRGLLVEDYRLVDDMLVYEHIKWPTEKPAAFVTIDDRAITFTGEWPSIDYLLEFKPWNKQKKETNND